MHNGSRLIEPVHLIVLTGGPCSGKSSSLAYLTEKLSDHGFMVFVVPETATLITNNGIDRRKMNSMSQVVMYEEAILDMQLSFEETYARDGEPHIPGTKKSDAPRPGCYGYQGLYPEGCVQRNAEEERAERGEPS